MSQNGDPKIAISISIYSIEGPHVGFMGGSIYINIHMYTCISMYLYIYIDPCICIEGAVYGPNFKVHLGLKASETSSVT